MTDVMERIRVTFDVPDPVRRAIAAYAADNNLSVGEVIELMATDYFPDYVQRAEAAIASGVKLPPRKGRPPGKRKT